MWGKTEQHREESSGTPTEEDSWTTVELRTPGSDLHPHPLIPAPHCTTLPTTDHSPSHLQRQRRNDITNCCVCTACLLSILFITIILILIPVGTTPALPTPTPPAPVHIHVHAPPVFHTSVYILQLPRRRLGPPPRSFVFVYNTHVTYRSLIIQGPLLTLGTGLNDTNHVGQLIMEEPGRNLTIFRDPRGFCFLHNDTLNGAGLGGNGTTGKVAVSGAVNGTGPGEGEGPGKGEGPGEVVRMGVEVGRRALRVVAPALGSLAQLGSDLASAYCSLNSTYWVQPHPEPPNPQDTSRDVVTFAVPNPAANSLIHQSIYFQ